MTILPRSLFVHSIGWLALVALSDPVARAQSLSPYDLGYAYQAAKTCPGVTLTVPVPEELHSDGDFADGVAMVEGNLERLSLARTCEFAMNLYSADDGKVAKILKRE